MSGTIPIDPSKRAEFFGSLGNAFIAEIEEQIASGKISRPDAVAIIEEAYLTAPDGEWKETLGYVIFHVKGQP
jgi:hypothetical protein